MYIDNKIADKINTLRNYYNSGKLKNTEYRIKQLVQLKKMLQENTAAILDALKKDLNKSEDEAWITEYNESVKEIDYMIKNVARWTKPKKVRTPLLQQPAASYIYKDPLGVVLIIGPWNYPFVLMISPLAGALAAGNCALLKPSEVSVNTSALLADLIPLYFDRNIVDIVEGSVEETTEILKLRFDHIFFTGGEIVGKVVMTAAAKYLTPVTLELGGKSPCIIDKTANIETAGKRIAWGKFINAGQTCIAPDYILVHRDIKDQIITSIRSAIRKSHGADPEKSESFGRIINENHFNRLTGLLNSGNTVFGGTTNPETKYIAPTILDNISADSPVMQEEIFGPILPVITIDNIDEAIRFVNKKPKPLALYLFSESDTTQNRILSETSSGGVCINDTIVHITSHNLPFGGVGTSGMGNYHGKASFDTFSHKKSVLKRSTKIDPEIRYPPYKPFFKKVIELVS